MKWILIEKIQALLDVDVRPFPTLEIFKQNFKSFILDTTLNNFFQPVNIVIKI